MKTKLKTDATAILVSTRADDDKDKNKDLYVNGVYPNTNIIVMSPSFRKAFDDAIKKEAELMGYFFPYKKEDKIIVNTTIDNPTNIGFNYKLPFIYANT